MRKKQKVFPYWTWAWSNRRKFIYTLLQNKRRRWFRAPPPPPPHHRSFENRWHKVDILYITLKGVVWRFGFSLNFSKIFGFRGFMSTFSRNDSPMAPKWVSEKISNFKNINILYIALKHVIWRFWICDYFRETFKFCDFMNTLTLLIPSYFGLTLYTKGGGGGGGGHLDSPYYLINTWLYKPQILQGMITWCFSLIIVKTSMKNRCFSNAPRNHKLEGVKIKLFVMIVLFMYFSKQ